MGLDFATIIGVAWFVLKTSYVQQENLRLNREIRNLAQTIDTRLEERSK